MNRKIRSFHLQEAEGFSPRSFTTPPSAKNGFSLIEILISISIVAIISGIVITSYFAAQRAGRDAQRQSELRHIQSALEHYNSDQQFYPTSPLPAVGSPLTNFTGRTPPPSPAPSTKTYLSTMPKDPGDNSAFGYVSLPTGCDNSVIGNCLQYCLYAKLENAPSASDMPTICSPAPSGYNFAITQP